MANAVLLAILVPVNGWTRPRHADDLESGARMTYHLQNFKDWD